MKSLRSFYSENPSVSYQEWRSCKSKGKIKSITKAQAKADQQSERSGEEIDFYSCRYCGFYHLGHKIPNGYL